MTGKPRVGKTTICKKAFDYLKKNGVDVYGVITREIVKGNKRVGFEILNLNTGESVLLAHVHGSGPKIGKYRVSVENIEKYMVKWIRESLNHSFSIVDEVGPMELLSKEFLKAVEEVVENSKHFIITVHLKKVNLIKKWGGKLIEITYQNRDLVWNDLKKMLEKVI